MTFDLSDWRLYVLALIAGWGGALFGYVLTQKQPISKTNEDLQI